jgi:hypothetical protein
MDDLEAVRTIVDTVKDFPVEEQQRIFRWAAEKLGLSAAPPPHPPHQPPAGTAHPASPPPGAGASTSIKAFIAEKRPRSDVQSTRKAGRERFANPLQTLSNAHKLGLLDRGSERGTFLINSVGENLVAMTLPDGEPVKKVAKKRAAKKA